MHPSIAARSSSRRPFHGWRGSLWLIIVGLLLRSAVPMLAAAAAEVRGVGVADVCPVYGVQTLPLRVVEMSAVALMSMSMSSIASTSGMTGAHGAHGHHATGSGDVGAGHVQAHGHNHHHQDTASDHDHCVLTPLLGASPVAAAEAWLLQITAGAEVHVPASRAAASPHDASRTWYALDAHPPPFG